MTVFAIMLWIGCLALCALGLSKLQLIFSKPPAKPTPVFPVKHHTIEDRGPQSLSVLPTNLRSLFWQVVKARKGLALTGQSQVLILAKVPVSSFLSLPEQFSDFNNVLADILITNAQFQPLIVISAVPEMDYEFEQVLNKARIGLIHVTGDIDNEVLTGMLYEALSRHRNGHIS